MVEVGRPFTRKPQEETQMVRVEGVECGDTADESPRRIRYGRGVTGPTVSLKDPVRVFLIRCSYLPLLSFTEASSGLSGSTSSTDGRPTLSSRLSYEPGGDRTAPARSAVSDHTRDECPFLQVRVSPTHETSFNVFPTEFKPTRTQQCYDRSTRRRQASGQPVTRCFSLL